MICNLEMSHSISKAYTVSIRFELPGNDLT